MPSNPLDLIPWLKDRATLQKSLVGFLALGIAIVGMLVAGGDEERDSEVIESLCGRGLNELAGVGGLDLCTHGPDARAELLEPAPRSFTPVGQSRLCPGDGVSGPRIHVFSGPSDDLQRRVRPTLGYAQRYLSLSSSTHTQRLRFLCSEGKPVVEIIDVPWETTRHFSTFVSQLRSLGHDRADRIYLYVSGLIPEYPYCGQANVGVDKIDGVYREQRQFPNYALVGCVGPSVATLHELGHSIGTVVPEAPHSSGDGWHCFERETLMCYNDGGSYFAGGGTMQSFSCVDKIEPEVGPVPLFDCNHDDFWNPGHTIELPWNSADSRFLTPPRTRA